MIRVSKAPKPTTGPKQCFAHLSSALSTVPLYGMGKYAAAFYAAAFYAAWPRQSFLLLAASIMIVATGPCCVKSQEVVPALMLLHVRKLPVPPHKAERLHTLVTMQTSHIHAWSATHLFQLRYLLVHQQRLLAVVVKPTSDSAPATANTLLCQAWCTYTWATIGPETQKTGLLCISTMVIYGGAIALNLSQYASTTVSMCFTHS
jgi:hypothetical protein